MNEEEESPPILNVGELIATEKENKQIKAKNIKFRREIALRDRVAAQLKREKSQAAQKKRTERENKSFEEALAKNP